MHADSSRTLLFLFAVVWITGMSNAAQADPLAKTEGSSATEEWNVDRLIRELAKQSEDTVSFEETFTSAMLTTTLKTRGTLTFTPPSRLEKHVTDPYDERYVVDGDRVLFENKKKRINRTLSLEDYPALRIFVEAFRSSLAGDLKTLRHFYDVTLEGEPRQWTLILHPLDRATQSMVQTVRLSGAGDQIMRIETLAPDGDRSVMAVMKAHRE